MAQYIQVVEDEMNEPVEIPSEPDGTLLLTTLSAQFPGAYGLKYRNSDTGAFSGIRLLDGVLHPPDGLWGNYQYLAVFSKEGKRKGEDSYDNPAVKLKTRRLDRQKCSDLIVLGLPWKINEDDLAKYFQQFGDLVFVQVKYDIKTGQSKGFGFIRFVNYESQVKCRSQRHMIDGRWCVVTIPNSKLYDDKKISQYQQGYNFAPHINSASRNFGSGYGSEGSYQWGNNQMMNHKVFIGRVPEDIGDDDLRSYFSKYGEVVHVFLPKVYRAFAFVTFADAETAQALFGEDHTIKGASVHVSRAVPKTFHKGAERKGIVKGGGNVGGGYNQGGCWGQQGPGGPGPVGGGNIANGSEPMGGNLDVNFFKSAMLAVVQVILQNQVAWCGMNQGPSQGNSVGNMGN